MLVRWIQYPDDEARRAMRDGRPREGQAWAAPGPIPGTIWVIPADEADRLYLVVHVYPNAPEANYALDTEQISTDEAPIVADARSLAEAAAAIARAELEKRGAPLVDELGGDLGGLAELGITVTLDSHEALT